METNLILSKESSNRPTDSLTEQVKASLAWVEGVAGFLNLDNPTKLEMLKQVAGPLGMPVPVCVPMHAPADKIDLTTNRRDRDPYYDLYISGKIKSATKLLREHGSKMKARTFNKLLVEKGYLEVVTVPSDTRGQRTYNKITEAGLEFGVNLSIGSSRRSSITFSLFSWTSYLIRTFYLPSLRSIL